MVTTGSEQDLETGTRTARDGRPVGHVRAHRPGLGAARRRRPARPVSDALLNAVDEEVRCIIEQCYQQARARLEQHRDRLDAIAERMLDQETLEEAQLYAIAGVSPVGSSTQASDTARTNRADEATGPAESLTHR